MRQPVTILRITQPPHCYSQPSGERAIVAPMGAGLWRPANLVCGIVKPLFFGQEIFLFGPIDLCHRCVRSRRSDLLRLPRYFCEKKFPLKFQYDTNQIFLTAYMTDSCHKLFSSCGQTSSSFAAPSSTFPQCRLMRFRLMRSQVQPEFCEE